MADILPVMVDVIGVHPRFARLLLVEISVAPMPPKRWVELFNDHGGDGGRRPDFAPRAKGDAIAITPPDSELEMHVQAVERRMRQVNAKLAKESAELTPQPIEAARVSHAIAQEAFSPDVRERILAARSVAARMSDVFQSSQWEVLDLTAPNPRPTRDTVVDCRPAFAVVGRAPAPFEPKP